MYCPECGRPLQLDEGEEQTFYGPGYGPEWYCEYCGYSEPDNPTQSAGISNLGKAVFIAWLFDLL